MRTLLERAQDYLGSELIVGNNNYGIVIDIHTVCDGNAVQNVVLICDSGRNVDFASVLRFLSTHGKTKYYPDGTDYVERNRQKKPYRYNVVCAASIPSNVRIGKHTISITSRED